MNASLSLDLDNKWSYLKTHGDSEWAAFPSYLEIVVPRVLGMLAQRKLRITWFVVGQDAALDRHHSVLKSIADAGHEIGNHSFHHEPWLHLYSEEKIEAELRVAEEAIVKATGVKPKGFRGPGFSLSPGVLSVLSRRGYEFDCSTFPTYLGPLARAYYFMTAKLSAKEKRERAKLFGTFAEGHRPLKPYRWRESGLVEVPVTTLPLFKTPIHLSYLLYLARFSKLAARMYFSLALWMCRRSRTEPSMLLHPLDFLGCDDDSDLNFFPAMDKPAAWKLELAGEFLDQYAKSFTVLPMGGYVRTLPRILPLRSQA